MIHIRAIVKFKANNRDRSKYIVREIRAGHKVLVQSLDNSSEYYLVGVDDVVISAQLGVFHLVWCMVVRMYLKNLIALIDTKERKIGLYRFFSI